MNAHKVYLDSDGESPGFKKKKREIKEEKEVCLTVALHDDGSKDPDLFGDDQDKPATKGLKIN